MGKSKRPLPGEMDAANFEETDAYDNVEPSEDEFDDDLYADYDDLEEMGLGDIGIEAELMDGQQARQYLNEAHDALARLSHKNHKRGQHLHKRPRRTESWQ